MDVLFSIEKATADSLVSEGTPLNPADGSYGGSMPNTIDSIGWLHNAIVKDIVYNTTSLDEDTIIARTKTYLIKRGWPTVGFSFLNLDAFQPELDTVLSATDGLDMIDKLNSFGYTVEAVYLEGLIDDIHWLYDNAYDFEDVLVLIAQYKDDVDFLSLSNERKVAFKNAMSVLEYSLAMWTENLPA